MSDDAGKSPTWFKEPFHLLFQDIPPPNLPKVRKFDPGNILPTKAKNCVCVSGVWGPGTPRPSVTVISAK